MTHPPRFFSVILLRFSLQAACCLVFTSLAFADPTQNQWVTQDDQGHLHYQATPKGDKIPDFSYAGYGGGGVALPNVPVQKAVAPAGDDDTSAIQAAIDAVAALPPTDGFRGAVLLGPGTFHCARTLTLTGSGVVLRGSGSGEKGTVIEMTGDPHLCLQVNGKNVGHPRLDPALGISITDGYVPAGAVSVTVADASGLAPGDRILIERKFTAAWMHSLGMDTLVRNGKPQTWIHLDQEMTYERTIRSVEGKRITFDIPMPDAMDAQLLTPDTAKVFKLDKIEPRPAQIGIESLQINSPPPTGILTTKNNHAIEINNCEDCWVKDVTMRDTLQNIDVLGSARRVTIEGANAYHTATVGKGAGYPADYTIRGTQILLDRSTSTGHGSFYVATANTESTLNVVLNCNFYGVDGDGGAIQPHARWSTSMLVDSCNVPDGKIEYINRGTAGSGHGWAMSWGVVWNCTAKIFNIQQPPGAINWCIGCKGGTDVKTGVNEGFVSFGTPVLPKSLYLAQLRERLGEGALKNIGY